LPSYDPASHSAQIAAHLNLNVPMEWILQGTKGGHLTIVMVSPIAAGLLIWVTNASTCD